MVDEKGRCKVCTLLPPCQHVKTISHEKQFAIMSKFLGLTKINKPPPKPVQVKRKIRSVLPPRPDNVKQMLTDMNHSVENNKMLA